MRSGATARKPRDVGFGYVASSTTIGEGDWIFEAGATNLGCPQGWKPSPESERARALRKGKPQDDTFVLQHTGRYPPGAAADYLDEIRSRVAACRPRPGTSVRIAAQGFAGQQSLLVVFDYGEGSVSKHIFVREGDVLTEIFAKPARSDQASRQLGRRAAARF